jgi:hypothetical protein
MAKKTTKSIPIPERGNLGLLAYGHKGLIAWRRVVREENEKRKLKGEKQDGK